MTTQRDPLDRFFSIIPAGGIGSRLWPLSRASAPKFLHDLTGSGQTLLQDTWDRLTPIAGKERILVVTGKVHKSAVLEQIEDLSTDNLVLELSPKDSTAAIALAAAILMNREPDVIVGSFAADHVITEDEQFHKTVREAVLVAATGKIVTIGIEPTEPSVGFGYIKSGDELGVTGAPEARHVIKFVEKPNIAKARKYVDSGQYLWNAGMFIAPAALLLEQLAKSEPALHASIMELAAEWDTDNRKAAIEKIWPTLKKVAIDYSVAEPAAAAGLVAVIPASFSWHDVGDFAAIAELQSQGRRGNLAVLGNAKVLADSSSGILVSDTDRLIALIGVEDIIVVDTPDALLVTTKEHAQRVKSLVDALKATGHSDVL
ncbi:mannose-1-phosphate guanylyltransferase [Rhodoluna lacicola]|jgi:mannose-1-phosphate guanylyltransferase|uniref:Mannose-1-phosphate guanylyltransferase n=1 Tax=Rhodoluna lacicola TaxID=529884 RepID=A0A060JGT4_9MICO|nr:mannose-1-phosphate guanylyltransferase [Rhodoluna lacicola]AIC47945.1 Mannose-1-phosphate guanylyltransferase [Rhodoluna lacicola]BDS50851.1 mannose-1-phosphate guanyltransferase [Rhodoluna lacicola]